MSSPYSSGPVFGYASVTGNRAIDALTVWGFKWGAGGAGSAASITYSFPSYGATWIGDYLGSEPFDGFTPFTLAQKSAARQSLAAWSSVANISFTEVADTSWNVGELRFGNSAAVSRTTSAAWGYLPYRTSQFEYPESGDVWFDKTYGPNLQLGRGQFGYSTMLHEIGHAIGLDHPFADEPGEIALPKAQDNQRYTIMSYTLYGGATIEAYGPMLYDILALQYIYGANMTTRSGDNVYKFSTSLEYLECIWDAGGHDTIDLSNQTRNQVINLNAGTFSSIGVRRDGQTANGNVAIAFNVTIEDAIGGAGNDTISGNAVANRLRGGNGKDLINGAAGNDRLEGESGADVLKGGAGNDILIGGTGNDIMEGGSGSDTYFVNSSGDVVSEIGVGIDIVYASASFALGPTRVENLTLTGSAISGTGNAYANTIVGNAVGNILDGMGGADLLKGGAGNDTYILDNAGDVVDEGANADLDDVVKTSVQVSTAINGIERYIYIGTSAWTFTGDSVANKVTGGVFNDTLDGAGGNDRLTGNGGKDLLIGGTGNDWLDGGTGIDVLKGGAGNDTYVIDAAGDVIDEEGNADTDDLVRSSVSINLTTLGGGEIEHAVLFGTVVLSAIGNAGANRLTANDSSNYLDGGAGNDTLTGGLGKDVLVGGLDDDSLDGGAGHDKLDGGSGNDTLVGNTGNDTLIGGLGDDFLHGGLGADVLKGGAGNDTYVLDAATVIDEETNTDFGDRVLSSVNVDLATLASGKIEHATLLGTAALNAFGNATGNELTGNAGANKLSGGDGDDTLCGGGGMDTLTGGQGSDTFDFNLLSEAGDTITDFVTGVGGDVLDLRDLLASFGYGGADPFGDGFLSFVQSSADTIVQVDADGVGGGGTTNLATLLGVALTAADTNNYLV